MHFGDIKHAAVLDQHGFRRNEEARHGARDSPRIRRRALGQVSCWDATIIESARAAGSVTVLSEDLHDGQNFHGVRVVTRPLAAVTQLGNHQPSFARDAGIASEPDDAPVARSGGDGETTGVADVNLLAIPAVRLRCVAAARSVLSRVLDDRERPDNSGP